jgi:serine/threonine-protein kinase
VTNRVGDETLLNYGRSHDADPLVGTTVDSYEIQARLGEGSMGIVYRGLHTLIGKPVAIKVLKPDFARDVEMVNRLIREARTVNAIKHPGIVDIFGFGTLPKTAQPFIVMDLLEGEALDEYIARLAPLPLKTIQPILDELLSALAAAHHVGVIHRDLKPGNVFLERHPDGRSRVKLLDFGLARQADRAGGSINPTSPGMLMGTPAFMAPEQVLGEKIGPHTDLYALGGIAYQMVTGHLPHEAAGTMELLSLKLKTEPPSPKTWNARVSDEFQDWILSLLKRAPEARLRDADEARRQLRRIVEGRTIFTSPPTPAPVAAPSARSWSDAKTVIVQEEELPRTAPKPAAAGSAVPVLAAAPVLGRTPASAPAVMLVPPKARPGKSNLAGFTSPMWAQPSASELAAAQARSSVEIAPDIMTDPHAPMGNRLPIIATVLSVLTVLACLWWLLTP